MTVVGSAEVLIKANTAGFSSEMKKGTDEGLNGLSKDADAAGKDAGSALRTGVKDEAGKIEGDLGKEGEKGGAALSKGVGGGMSKLSGMLSNLGLPLGPLTEGLGKAGEKAQETEGKSKGLFGSLKSIGGPALLGIAGGFVAAAGEGMKMGEAMQSADAQIAVSSGTSVASAKAIGDAFLGTAGKTEFTGQEMATAYAGVAGQLKTLQGHALTTKQATDFMSTAMDLATAKGIPLNTSTATLSATMQAFQVPVKDAAKASDALFTASNMTGEGIDTLSQGLIRMKARMGANAPSLQQMSGLLVDMTEHGISGRMALRGLSTGMASLTGPSKAVSKEAQELGLQIYNSSGKFVGMQSVLQQLGPKFASMSQQQRAAAATALFGAGASQQLTAVINAGAGAYDKATEAVSKNGTTADGAAKKSKTLKVEQETLKATVEDLTTEFGEMLIPIVQKMGSVLVTAGQFVLQHKAILIGLGVIIGTVLVAAIGAYLAAQAVATATTIVNFTAMMLKGAAWVAEHVLGVGTVVATDEAGAALSAGAWIMANLAMTAGILAVVAVVAAAVFLIIKYHKDIEHAVIAVWDAIKNTAESLVNDVENFFSGLPGRIIGGFDSLPGRFAQLGRNILNSLINALKGMGGELDHIVKGAVSHIPLVGGALSKLATGGIVTKPTIALVGEAGPEAVIPLSGMPGGVLDGNGVEPLGAALNGPASSSLMSGGASPSGSAAQGGVVLNMPISFEGVTDVNSIIASLHGAVGQGFSMIQQHMKTGTRPGTPVLA